MDTSSRPFSSLLLPSSFTTLLLSILDSPAYANLTSAYLNNVFNPATPNDPRVKYFSVAGRMPSVNIWHPFWLPKTVIDGVETKERKRMKEQWESANQPSEYSSYGTDNIPLWAREDEWGNDGLVTVQSSKWGEFLGVMEGCDRKSCLLHDRGFAFNAEIDWEMRGARGIEFGVDLPGFPAIGLGDHPVRTEEEQARRGSDGDGDGWSWLIKAWRKDEKNQRDAAALNVAASTTKSGTSRDKKREKERLKEADDVAVKSSTDKLSAVFDWLSEQVPTTPLLGTKSKTAGSKIDHDLKSSKDKTARRNELETKEDLERFYVALSRKLYDEGL